MSSRRSLKKSSPSLLGWLTAVLVTLVLILFLRGLGGNDNDLAISPTNGGQQEADMQLAQRMAASSSGTRAELPIFDPTASSNLALPTVLEVLGPDGEPLNGVTVIQVTQGTEELDLGRTKNDGILELSAPLPPGRIVLLATGMATLDRVHSGLALGTRQTYRMQAERVIRGRVLERGTFTPIEGAVVWAMPKDANNHFTFIDPYRAELLSESSVTSRHARTASDGSFELGGLAADQKYDVSAIRPGWRTVDALVGIEPSADPIELHMAHCWGVVVQLTTSAGEELPSPPTRIRQSHRLVDPLWRVLDKAVDFEVSIDRELLDAWGETVHHEPSTVLVVLCYSRNGEEDLGNLQLVVDLPGFEPVERTIPMRFIEGRIPVERVALTKSPTALSRSKIRFVDLPQGLDEIDPDQHAGTLHLHAPEGPAYQFELDFADLVKGSFTPMVPTGTYEVHLLNGNAMSSVPEAGFESEVDRRGSALMTMDAEDVVHELDCSGFSLLRVVLFDQQGGPYTGLLNFELFVRRFGPNGVDETLGSRTLVSKWRRPGEAAGALLGAGTYRIEPIPYVASLTPERQVGAHGRFVEPLIVSIGRGEVRTLEWISLDPALFER